MARLVLLVVSLLASGLVLAGQQSPALLVGAELEHVVRKGDTWQSISARFGVEPVALAAINKRTTATRLTVGEVLRVDNHHLVPAGLDSGIVINVPQRMLFVKDAGQVRASYPVGLGRPDWPTFVGPFTIVVMETDPAWDVPPSIQEELRRAGKNVITRVEPGPANPLGKFWLGLSAPGYGIHGTNAPTSIFRFQSHGCVRLHPDDIADLWARVFLGMRGEIVYEPVLLRVTHLGILLEAHPDIYRRQAGDAEATVWSRAIEQGVSDEIEWVAVSEVLRRRDGRPHLVARGGKP